jgi:outer membrane protein assembly factor BamA
VIGIGLEGSLEHDVNENLYSYTKWEAIGDLLLGDQWTLRFGRGGSRAVETIEGASPETEGYFLAGVDLDKRNSARNPERGFRITGESRRGTKTFTPDSVEVRIDRTHWLLGGETYQPVGRKWLGVLRGKFEFLQTPEDSVPRWDEIAVGGANSLRGYREDQFLTLGATILQGEWRLRQDNLGSAVYAFADAGFIQDDGHRLGDLFDRFLLGTGLGIRQAKGPGILSLEYGIPKGSSPLEGRLHVRLDAVF